MTLPEYAVDFRGYPACPCLAAWLPVYEAELQRQGLLIGPLRIFQLIGGAPQSGGTHTRGGAFDLLDLPGEQDLVIGRQMGADAYWTRPTNWDGRGGIRHNHGVLTDCPHNGPARYQIDAVRDGFNGLGTGGRGAPDPGPRPLSGRTWRQGIEWARALQEEHEMTPDQAKQLDAIQADTSKTVTLLERAATRDAKRWAEMRGRLRTLRTQGTATAADIDQLLALAGDDEED